jgi:uncharacterized protein
MSWVALEDVVAILRLALIKSELRGPINVVAPEPVRNAEFVKGLAKTMHRPAIFPAPAFALRLAMGEMADALLLSSQRAVAQKLTGVGYSFASRNLKDALERIFA